MTSDNKKEIRVLAIIPARGGSKGVKKKNIVEIHGKPLIYYTIREVQKSVKIDAAIVSTDDLEIAAAAKSLGADVPFIRPAEYATDSSRDIEYLQHALTWAESERGWKPEIILFLPPTSPSRTAEDIDAAITLLEDTGADSVRTMVHAPHFNPYKMWIDGGDGGKVEPLFPEGLNSVPRQELRTYYMPVAIAYVTRAKNLREGSVWGSDVRMLPFPLDRFTDIDTQEDVEEASRVLERYNLL